MTSDNSYNRESWLEEQLDMAYDRLDEAERQKCEWIDYAIKIEKLARNAESFLRRHHASQVAPHEWFSPEIEALYAGLGGR